MELVWSGRENRKAQARLEEWLREALPVEEIETIGFRPATVRLPVHRSGSSGLWWASDEIDRGGATPRFWNAFGTSACASASNAEPHLAPLNSLIGHNKEKLGQCKSASRGTPLWSTLSVCYSNT